MKYLKAEQQKEVLNNEAGQIEAQILARERDVRFWKQMETADLGEAVAADSRIANNRDDEVKQQLAAANYDLIKLRTKLALIEEDLAALAPKSSAASAGGD